MKKPLIILLIITAIIGCNIPHSNSYLESVDAKLEKARQDSIALADSLAAIFKEEAKRGNSMDKESFLDTTGVYLAPVKVTKAVFFRDEYSSFYSIRLNYKNTSGRNIQAIRFEWYGENAFGEPADMTGIYNGYGGGFSDDLLRAGSSTSSVWSVLSRDGKKVIGARAYEVAFSDGTKWERKK